VAAMVDKAASEWGRLDILVNNAGVMLLAPAAEADLDDWRRMIELNLVGLMGTTKAALPHLKASKGHVVNVSSVAGRVANPGASGYAATKFGVVAFSESLRREVYADKVRVTVIEPGLVRTELGDHITNQEFKAGLEHRLATMEALTAEDIANAILYAVSQPPRVNINEILIRPTDQER
ncbi:SDR family NAD(P)-dependent oxidoreductase, partial [Mesorhizobium sp. USDA-HM6]